MVTQEVANATMVALGCRESKRHRMIDGKIGSWCIAHNWVSWVEGEGCPEAWHVAAQIASALAPGDAKHDWKRPHNIDGFGTVTKCPDTCPAHHNKKEDV